MAGKKRLKAVFRPLDASVVKEVMASASAVSQRRKMHHSDLLSGDYGSSESATDSESEG